MTRHNQSKNNGEILVDFPSRGGNNMQQENDDSVLLVDFPSSSSHHDRQNSDHSQQQQPDIATSGRKSLESPTGSRLSGGSQYVMMAAAVQKTSELMQRMSPRKRSSGHHDETLARFFDSGSEIFMPDLNSNQFSIDLL